MKYFKVALKKISNNKVRTTSFIFTFSLVILIWLYSLTFLQIEALKRLEPIKDLAKDSITISSDSFKNQEVKQIDGVKQGFVYLPQSNLSDGFSTYIIDDNLIDVRLPYIKKFENKEFLSSGKTKIIYGLDNKELLKNQNSIVIGENLALNIFRRKNVVGETIKIKIDDVVIDFTIQVVIKILDSNTNLSTGAFIFKSCYEKISKTTNNNQKLIVEVSKEVNADTVKMINETYKINIDDTYKVEGYYNEKMKIDEISKLSFNGNLLIIGFIGITFILVCLNSVINSVILEKLNIAYMKTIGISQKGILKINFYEWIIKLLTSTLLGGAVSFVLLYINLHKYIIKYFEAFITNYILISLVAILLLLLIIIPMTFIMFKSKNNLTFRREDDF